jgi:dienelactone hydrolase/subtilisin-like proprotein convertase family protein
MKQLLLIVSVFCAFSTFAQFQIGTTTITFNDPGRTGGFGSGGGPGRQIQTEIYYPATSAGSNAPFVNDSFPVIVFGHGFSMAWDAYANVWQELVPKGYIVAFPRTEGGLSPSHNDFGLDLALVNNRMKLLATDASSIFFNHVGVTSAIMGHSMGGGAAFLAAQNNTNITALATLAPANTNPSSIDAAAFIKVPSLVIAGANDCVTPAAEHQLPMYNNLASACKTYLSFTGASHCQFANSNFNCNFGESTCSPSPTISRTEQHTRTFTYLVPWLNKVLKGDCHPQANFDALLASSTTSVLTHQQSCASQAGLDVTFCDGAGTATLGTTIMSGYSFDWTSNPAGFTSSLETPTVNPTETTSYYLTYTNLHSNCVMNDTVTVSFSESPSVDAGADTGGCAGAVFTIGTEGSGGITYLWTPSTNIVTPNASLSDVSISTPGNYSYVLRATNALGCSSTDTVVVQVSPVFQVNTSNDANFCVNSTTELTASVEPFMPSSFQASGLPLSIPDNTPSGGLQTGNTMPTLTQLNATNLAVASVTIPTGNYVLQGLTVSINHTFCADLDLYLRAPNDQIFLISTDNGGGTANYNNITFADNGATVPPANTAMPANSTYLPEGALFSTYTGDVSGLWRLYVIDDANADVGSITAFRLNVLETPANLTYSWTPAENLTDAEIANPMLTVVESQTYTVTVTSQGCSINESVSVGLLLSPEVNAGEDRIICIGETVSIGQSAETDVTYAWTSSPAGFSSTSSQVDVTPGTSTIYTLTATNSITGCTASDEVSVQIESQPSAAISLVGSTTICQGDSVLLIASPNYANYTWSNGTVGNDSIYVSTSGSYSVVLGNSENCSATSNTITITVNPVQVPVISADETSICQGTTATLTVTNVPFSTYSWNGVSSNTSSATVSNAGTYSVTTTDANACSATSNTITISVNSATTPTITQDGFTLTSSTASSYQWFLNGVAIAGATSQTYTATENGSYSVQITDNNGCSATSNPVTINTVNVLNVQHDQISIYPNPAHSVLTIDAVALKSYSVTIFAANGQLIFASNDVQGVSEISVQHWTAGVYLVHVLNDSLSTVTRIIKE